MTLLANTVQARRCFDGMQHLSANDTQPSLVTLLSSTTHPALSPLFSAITDPSCPSYSAVQIIRDDMPASSGLVMDEAEQKGSLAHPVIHLQSPDIRRTYIQAGVSSTRLASGSHQGVKALGIELPWLGLHFRPLGGRPTSFEVGVVDAKHREGVIRISTFKVSISTTWIRLACLRLG